METKGKERARKSEHEMDKFKSSKEIVELEVVGLSDCTIFVLSGLIGLISSIALFCAMSYYLTGTFTLGSDLSAVRGPILEAWYTRFPRTFTKEELARYDGTDESLPIYLAVKGKIYDVTAGKNYYGKGHGYNVFAGRDGSRGFHDMCFTEECLAKIDDLEGLTEAQAKSIDHWAEFYAKEAKYPYVGELVKSRKFGIF